MTEDRRRWADALLDDMFDGILYCDGDNVIIEANRAAALLLGFADVERRLLIGQPIARFIDPADLEAAPIESRRAALVDGKGKLRSRRRMRARDGSVRIVDAGQTMLARDIVRIAFRDITEEEEARHALALRERALRDALRAARMATIEWSPGSGAVRLSPEAASLFEIGESELPRSAAELLALVEARDREQLDDAITRHREPSRDAGDGAPLRITFRVKRSTLLGFAWLKLMGTIERHPDTGLVRLIGTIHDVTDRVEAERVTEQREARYRQFFERNSAAQLITDATTGVIVDANPAAARLYRRSRDELQGLHGKELAATDISAEFATLVRQIQTGERTYFRRRHRDADGRVRVVDVHTGPIEDEDRQLLHSIVLDVTELVEAEQERQYLLDMLDASPNPVAQRLPDGTPVYANAAARAMRGVPEGAPLPNVSLEQIFTPEAWEHYRTVALPTALRDGSWHGETTLVSADGQPLPMTQSLIAHRAPDGALVRISSMLSDIGALRAREAELARANEALTIATRLKSEFLANMSHELRTPLNAILGFSQLLHDGVLGNVSEEQQDALNDVLTSGRHLLRVIDDILDLAKVERGTIELRPQPMQVDALVAEVVDSLRAVSDGNGIATRIEPDDARAPFRSDPTRVRQILYNFLSNAIKFTPTGGEVTIRSRQSAGRLRLEVSDTGIGIDPDDHERLFVEFQQLDQGLGRRYPGTGLGLAFCRRLAHALGGEVGVVSARGEGSTFWVELPESPLTPG